MLLGEWAFQQRTEDSRCYKLICCHLQEPPPPEKLFPSLAAKETTVDDTEEDVALFQKVAASLPGVEETNG